MIDELSGGAIGNLVGQRLARKIDVRVLATHFRLHPGVYEQEDAKQAVAASASEFPSHHPRHFPVPRTTSKHPQRTQTLTLQSAHAIRQARFFRGRTRPMLATAQNTCASLAIAGAMIWRG